MGINQSSSCRAGSSCSVIPTSSFSLSLPGAYTGSMKDGSVMEPCAAARVLLLDGWVLYFPRKVRVSHVLAGFRHHCLCPLDSASLSSSNDSITTFFKPLSMHPDDLLRPPCVYILLPRRTFRQFATAAAAATCSDGNGGRTHRHSGSKVCDSGAYSGSGSGTATGSKARCSNSSGACKIGTSSTVDEATNSSRLCNAGRCPSRGAHGTAASSHVPPKTTIACGTLSTSPDISCKHRARACKRIPVEPDHIHIHAANHTQPARSTQLPLAPPSILGSTTASSSSRRSLQQRKPRPRMRRCRSWRPELQAINEVHVYS